MFMVVPSLPPRSPVTASFVEIHGAHSLTIPPRIRHQNSLGMSPLHQVVIAHDVLFAGDGLIVPQEIDGVHVAVIEMPTAVVIGLGNAVPERPGWRRLQARLAPECGQANGIIAAGVVTINVEDFDRVEEFVVVAARMVAIAGSPGTRAQRPSRPPSCLA